MPEKYSFGEIKPKITAAQMQDYVKRELKNKPKILIDGKPAGAEWFITGYSSPQTNDHQDSMEPAIIFSKKDLKHGNSVLVNKTASWKEFLSWQKTKY